ncbi:MAG: glycoside hydrolase family 15 protein [Nocardiopsaceae bacterium]|jgi:GH15 family glucan-1,4-alpha-glucosidase|nr:glycoside hydrolase family 15 protein [Nocardiopsaceae bacterium]
MQQAKHKYPAIEDYALVGDMQSAALISRDGSVDWLCLPRFDSDAVFAAMLGDGRNGQWRLNPTAQEGPPTRAGRVERQYRKDTLILETVWTTVGGVVKVIDFMPPRGADTPVLIRIVEGVEGTVEMETHITMRFGYGRIVPWVRRVDQAVWAVAGPDSIWIWTPVKLVGRELAHQADFLVRAGERVPFVLTWMPSHKKGPPPNVIPLEALEQTASFWQDWVSRCTYDGRYRDPVVRSLITVKALTYAPTGGIVAAPTTSLPEDIGGVRNWDYRYCWLRDSTLALEGALRTGYVEEADAWREWLGRAVAGSAADVQIMYGVAGERRLPEWTADWLPGYEGSAPVRIGNDAVKQIQLDVYGEVVDTIMLGRQAGLRFDKHAGSLIDHLLSYLEQHWNQPDEGIWEVRGGRQHFVYSKVMAWVALDRRIKMAETGLAFAPEPKLKHWRSIRDEIHAQVCEHGYDARRGTFTQYYGSDSLDAALLLMADTGFLPADDERVISTIKTIRRELTRDGLVLRYTQPENGTSVDGLPGSEGAFLACSFWMVNALHWIGEEDDATAMFERLLELRSDVGLLSEEYDPRLGRQVGNSPQAFSHVPMIQAALNLDGHDMQYARRSMVHGRG